MNLIAVAAGETRLVFTEYGGGGRSTTWSNSTADYPLFILTEVQYDAYGNTTGTNGTIPFHPPSQYYWTSGLVRSTNNTFRFGSGNCYLMVYDPAESAIEVNVISSYCYP